jgi:glycosyltransferase involved in cell wall biosynthesis
VAQGQQCRSREKLIVSRPTVHLVYPVSRAIRAPDIIGATVKAALQGSHYVVKCYQPINMGVIKPEKGDILLGHWHPNPFTIFRRSLRQKGFAKKILLAPFCPDLSGAHHAFGEKAIQQVHTFLAITGNAWMKFLPQAPFSHWAPKVKHLDLAVDREKFPLLKKKFSPKRKRSILYIGSDLIFKNVSYLSKIAEALPDIKFAWIGNGRPIEGVTHLGPMDFATAEAKQVLQDYDFTITVGYADANPTTILESMAWGLIPLCSRESGYEGYQGIVNLSLNDVGAVVNIINELQGLPEDKLKFMQKQNLELLDSHFNWERFSKQVLEELEVENEELISIVPQYKKMKEMEKKSPYYWLKWQNLWSFIKSGMIKPLVQSVQSAN